MKRLAKTPFLLLAISSLLTACSQKSIAGTYGFQLGKEKGTHFGIYLNLSDKKFKDEEHPEIDAKAKKCSFSFSANLDGDSSELAELLNSIKAILNQEGKKRVTIPGYYFPAGKVTRKGLTELKLGIDLNFIKQVIEDDDFPFPDIVLPVITPDKIETIVYTTYSNNTVTLNIPVSFSDVIYQLYWYGIDFSYDEAEDEIEFITSPYGEHTFGTHPTAEDVTAINEQYNYKDAHAAFAEKFNLDFGSYRDYYTLAMGLVKN